MASLEYNNALTVLQPFICNYVKNTSKHGSVETFKHSHDLKLIFYLIPCLDKERV